MRAVAHVILLVDNCYVLQLRDNKPNIAAPGKWSLFGGMVESGESPREALVREIQEELSIKLSNFRPFWVVNRFSDFLQELITYNIFESDITDLWGNHYLMEGQATNYFDYQELAGLDLTSVVSEILNRHHCSQK